MANTRFFLDKRAVKEPGKAVLKLVIAHQANSALITLVKIYETQWNPKDEVIINHDDSVALNSLISYKHSVVKRVIAKLMLDEAINNMTAAQIRAKCIDELEPEKKKKRIEEKETKISFIYRMRRYAERMGKGSQHTYNYTIKRITEFCAQPNQISVNKLKFEDITLDWLRQFDTFLEKAKSSKNTRNIHFRNMRAVFNEALDDEIISNYPFRRFKIKNEVTKQRVLTVEEIRTIAYLEVEECGERYRDYFMLMFFLMGINHTDLCHLKGMDRGRIEFHRQKTNHFFSMKVEPEAMAIIKKYKGENWLLNVLDEIEKPVSFLKQCNKYLKKMGPVTRTGLGGKKTYNSLFPKLSTYYSRHSWASIAADLEIPDGTISEGLGHEHGNKVTRGYIHKYSYKNIDNANRKVIDWVLYGIKDGEVVVKPGTPEFFGLERDKAIELGLVDESTLQEVPKVEKKKRGRPKKVPKD